jgi:hypothetical protein
MKMLRFVAPLIFVAACAAPGDVADGPTSKVSSAVIHGTDSTAAQDAVVLVMHYDAKKVGGDSTGCSGTLLAPRLVLTARHCVADTDETALCDSNGNAVQGGAIQADNAATKLYAIAGTTRPNFISDIDKVVRGAEIIDDGSKVLCNHDLALLLLEKALPGGKTAPIRLDGGPHKDEAVTLVGWGVTDKTDLPPVRQQRGALKIVNVGPADRLGSSEFTLGESACSGDSGGPLFADASGAVIGVVSRGGNASGAAPGDVARCIGPSTENVFTSTSGFKDLILSAYQKAGQDAWLEGQPDPATLPPKPPPADDKTSSGCTIGRMRPRVTADASSGLVVVFAAIAACVLRRRTTSCAREKSTG